MLCCLYSGDPSTIPLRSNFVVLGRTGKNFLVGDQSPVDCAAGRRVVVQASQRCEDFSGRPFVLLAVAGVFPGDADRRWGRPECFDATPFRNSVR